MEKNDCVFCRIISGQLNSNIVWQDASTLVIEDIHAQAPSHILIIPKQHVSDITECKDPAVLGDLFQKASLLATKKGLTNGFRLVVNTGTDGGQTVNHLHIHMLAGRPMSWPPG